MSSITCTLKHLSFERSLGTWRRQWYTTKRKAKAVRQCIKRNRREKILRGYESESDFEPFSKETQREFRELERQLEQEEDFREVAAVEEPSVSENKDKVKIPEFRIRHQFVGFDPRRMDLEGFPRLRTDFDGKRSGLIWMGTECQRCGLQIRRERRTNRETSLNVYANPSIPDELLRNCPEEKRYPVLWRTRDPYVALDILAVEDY